MPVATPLVLWWVKRDCRLADNPALHAAIASGRPVLPLFCFEPSVTGAADYSSMHQHAQTEAVTCLRARLRAIGSDVFVSYDEVITTLERIRAARPVEGIFAHEEIGNGITFARDRRVAGWCRDHGIRYTELPQSSVQRGGVNRDNLHRLWQQRIVEPACLSAPGRVGMTSGMRTSAAATELRALTAEPLWQPVSEAAAEDTLRDFLFSRGVRYRGGISSPNSALEAGSRLSVHLAWGTISLRTVYQATLRRLGELAHDSSPAANRWRASLRAFLSRLHWHDHFIQRLESEPEMEVRALHPLYRDIPWENRGELLEAWVSGRTGFHLIDAVMRCLQATGFVNFRMRAMVTSLACHALHLDWRLIHAPLARVFRDYEPGIHLSQLQMQAGVVGLNTIRVYNPVKQLRDQDPECRFVQRWLPELAGASPAEIIAAAEGGRGWGKYPAPIVDWAIRSRAMRDLLYARRRGEESRAATAEVFRRHGSRKSGRGSAHPRTPRRRSGSAGAEQQLSLQLIEEKDPPPPGAGRGRSRARASR